MNKLYRYLNNKNNDNNYTKITLPTKIHGLLGQKL